MRRALLLALAVAAPLTLAGCGSSGPAKASDGQVTSDLQHWLTTAHRYDTQYDDLGSAVYQGGDVTVTASHVWADQTYGAYFLCAWVEPWVRGADSGGATTIDSKIIVMMGGKEVLRSRGGQESCVDASNRTPLAGG